MCPEYFVHVKGVFLVLMLDNFFCLHVHVQNEMNIVNHMKSEAKVFALDFIIML